ncbi:MAG: NINE protein [Acidobacteriaceae bacterium]|nr:NINE protein [Acidobacteriaceae bacterium]
MSAWQKDEVVGVLLALFLGTFGAHHFYLRKNGLGILYIVFCWTGIPTIISIVECFFMPGRVRQYNLALATYFAAQISPLSGPETAPISGEIVAARNCPSCGAPVAAGTNFCGRCGAKTAGS